MYSCNKCSKPIKNADMKSCSQCQNSFHYQCLGIATDNFNKESKAYKSTWKCLQCKTSDKSTPTQSKANSQSNLVPNVIEELKKHFDKKLEDSMVKLRDDIKRDIKNDSADTKTVISELSESVNFMSSKYDVLKELLEGKIKIIDQLEAQNLKLLSQVEDLNTRLAQIEQKSRDCNLEIQCVPEHKSENIKNIVQHLATTIGCSLNNQDLLNYHRVAKINKESSRPRSIIVKLPSPLKRDEIIAAVKTYNRTHQKDKLNTSHLGLAGNKSPIYVSEHLSPSHKHLHAESRRIAREKKYEFVWVRNGQIYIRKNVNSKSFVVKNMAFLNSLD